MNRYEYNKNEIIGGNKIYEDSSLIGYSPESFSLSDNDREKYYIEISYQEIRKCDVNSISKKSICKLEELNYVLCKNIKKAIKEELKRNLKALKYSIQKQNINTNKNRFTTECNVENILKRIYENKNIKLEGKK